MIALLERGFTQSRRLCLQMEWKLMKRISLLLAATTMLWGSIYVCNKMLLDTVPGFTLLCLRYCIAAVVMLSFLAIQKKRGAHITGMVLSMGSALSWGIVSVCARSLTKNMTRSQSQLTGFALPLLQRFPWWYGNGTIRLGARSCSRNT